MKIDKEYPATHSMSTAWYCVDEDGNVGIFDIDDNGPVPHGCKIDLEVNEVFWYDFAREGKDGIKDLDLTMEQLIPMLMPVTAPNIWKEEHFDEYSWVENDSWEDVIIKIDMSKLPILVKAASMDKDDSKKVVCLSREEGYFFVNFEFNKNGVELLEAHNVVISKFKAPQYNEIYPEERSDLQEAENHRFPIFIYHEEFYPYEGAAQRMSNPSRPMKIDQLPKEIRENITHLPVKFMDAECIQLAEYLPVYISCAREKYVGDERWFELPSSNGGKIYYGEESEKVITEEEMELLLEQWEKEHGCTDD